MVTPANTILKYKSDSVAVTDSVANPNSWLGVKVKL